MGFAMRWLFRTFLSLALLVVLAGAGVLLIPSERLAALAAAQVREATGRELIVAGEIRPALWPHVGLHAQGVALSGPDWAEHGDTLAARSVTVGLDPRRLIRGEMVVATLVVEGAALTLERREDGVGSWGVGDAPAAGAAARALPPLSVPRAVLRDATLLWADHAAGTVLSLASLDLEARLPEIAGRAEVDLSALLDGHPVSLSGAVSDLGALLDGAPAAVEASLRSRGTAAEVAGRLVLEGPAFEGDVALETTDALASLAALGVAPPVLPEGFGADRASVEARATLTAAGTLHLREAVVALDDHVLSGGVDVDPNAPDRPMIAATLSAPALDLRPLMAGGARPSDARGWPTDPIDVSGLFAADARVSLATGPVRLPDLTVDALRAEVTLERGRAVVALSPARLHGGTATGEVVINGRGGLSARATLALRGVETASLLGEAAGADRLGATADADVSLLGAGDDVAALMRSLDGTAALRLGQGRFAGLDALGTIRTLDLGHVGPGHATAFDEVSASFAIEDGVARSTDLAMRAPLIDLAGRGAVDLGRRTLDWRLTPTLKAAEDATLAVPLLIDGAWDAPRVRPDLETIARRELAQERERLEAEAKREIEAKLAAAESDLSQRLDSGLEVPASALTGREAVEGAIKRRIESELSTILLGN